MEERTLLAERLQKYRIRKSEVKKIAEAMVSEAKEGLEEMLWSTLTAFEDSQSEFLICHNPFMIKVLKNWISGVFILYLYWW